MRLSLIRKWQTENATLGELYVDGVWKWYTCEDTLREPGVKIPGKTCIPAGFYQVILTMSARFKRVLPLLIGVPNFSGVRIHPGNTPADTEGCILVGGGINRASGMVLHSRFAMDQLMKDLATGVAAGRPIMLEIVDRVVPVGRPQILLTGGQVPSLQPSVSAVSPIPAPAPLTDRSQAVHTP